MSFSMLKPEEEPRCECFYVEARDTMDREDCPFHCDLIEDENSAKIVRVARKLPVSVICDESAA